MNPGFYVASVESVPGRDVLRKAVAAAAYTRKLVRVDASSIKWRWRCRAEVTQSHQPAARVLHADAGCNGHYFDPGYDAFTSWGQLWD